MEVFDNEPQRASNLSASLRTCAFGNPLAQAACLGDCAASSAHLPLDPLFWCNGCQGSLYPFSGTVADHTSGVQASLLLTGRMMAKLHREGLLWGYMGEAGLCGKYFMPVIHKSQYRTQMTYPRAQTQECQPFGKTEVLWQGGREYPLPRRRFWLFDLEEARLLFALVFLVLTSLPAQAEASQKDINQIIERSLQDQTSVQVQVQAHTLLKSVEPNKRSCHMRTGILPPNAKNHHQLFSCASHSP